MKFPRKLPRFGSLKFAPLAIISLFVFSNFGGVLFSRVLAPEVAAQPERRFEIPSDIPTSGNREIDLIVYRAGESYGVDPRLIHAVIWQESRYVNKARSHAGAQGLMQLMPATAKRFGCHNPYDPAANINAGTKYLSWLLKRFSGNVELALAGYNAGEGAVDKYDGVPPYDETRKYVRIISRRYGKAYHPLLRPEEAIGR